MLRSKGSRRHLDIWPGFVDAISSLLLVLVFLLAVFMMSEVFLTNAISGKNSALDSLSNQVSELNELLNIEKAESLNLSRSLDSLSKEFSIISNLNEKLNKRNEKLTSDILLLDLENNTYKESLKDMQLENKNINEKFSQIQSDVYSLNNKLTVEQNISAEAKKNIIILNKQISDLRDRIAKIQFTLDASEKDSKEKGIQIIQLGEKLNSALAKKVGELARYRSEFFGSLKEILGNRDDIIIVGDRFIFQSEILFESGSADIEINGQSQLVEVSKLLLKIANKIPKDLPWVLQIQGHTDNIPISNSVYPSNWELSVSRAISVAQILIKNNIPPERIAVAGYGEYRPLIISSDKSSLKKNRRIELKLTQP